MNARAYIRVSSERQTLGASLETQRAAIREYARAHNLTIVHEYTDILSGTRDDRPRYQSLLADSKPGEVILVWRVDRIGRKKSELFRLFEWCKLHHIGLVSVTQPEMSNELARDIMSVLAAYESQQLAERIVPNQMARAQEGRWMSKPPAYYVIGEDGHLAPGPNAADAQRMWDTVLATGNLTTTAAAFGYRPETLRGIVLNRVYIGEVRWRGIVVTDAHPPIVRRETWEAVETLLRDRNRARRREHYGTALLTGFVYVADTDVRMYHQHWKYHTKKKGVQVLRYYRSQPFVERPPHSVRAEDAERAVIERLAALELTRGEVTTATRELRALARTDPYKAERAKIARRIAALEREMIETARMEAQRRVTAHEADTMRAIQRRDLQSAEAARDALPPPPDTARTRAALALRLNLGALVRRAYAEGNIAALRPLVEAFIERVEIWGGEAMPVWKMPEREIRVKMR